MKIKSEKLDYGNKMNLIRTVFLDKYFDERHEPEIII